MTGWVDDAAALQSVGIGTEVFEVMKARLGDMATWKQLGLFPLSVRRRPEWLPVTRPSKRRLLLFKLARLGCSCNWHGDWLG